MRPTGIATAARGALARPGLFLWCGLIAAVDAVSVLVFLVLANGQGPGGVLGLLAVQRGVVIVVLAFTLPGCYGLYRQDAAERDGDRSRSVPTAAVGHNLSLVAGAARDFGPRLLASTLVTRAVAVPATVVLAVLIGWLFLGLDTAAVWASAVFDVPVDRGLLAITGVVASLAGGAWLTNGAVAYQDLLALDGEARPSRAWRESVVAATARPLWFVGQALFRGLLAAAPWIAAFAALIAAAAVTPGEDAGFTGLLATAVVFLVVAALARATLVAYHVRSYEARIRPAVTAGDRDAAAYLADERPTDDDPAAAHLAEDRRADDHPASNHPLLSHPRRIAVAAVFVLATIAGVGMVRTADVAPGPDVPDAAIEPANADATVRTAVERTVSRDFAFEYEERAYNRTTGTWSAIFEGSGRVDRDTPESLYTITFHSGDGETRRLRMYGADGIGAATAVPGTQIRLFHPMERRVQSGDWSAAIGRPVEWSSDQLRFVPADVTGWERVASDGETVTYETANLSAVDRSSILGSLPDPGEEDITYVDGPQIRVVVDREAATVRRLSVRAHYRDTYDEDDPRVVRRRTTVNVTAVGDIDVSRPEGLRGPGPLERLWDVVYYG